MARLAFWFDFASTYSYLSAMRIGVLARDAGVAVDWQPFLLGPIFRAQGWETSPFNVYPVKGRYMVRDMERITASRGLALQWPAVLPANSIRAARLALAGADAGWTADFSRHVFEAEFGRGADIASDAVLTDCLGRAGADANEALAAAASDAIKARLRRQTEAAQALGIFGAPMFVTENCELFWGDDRLEQALAWSRGVPRRVQ
jgi:2-hydroxychromene-2-carboxylate isomerase